MDPKRGNRGSSVVRRMVTYVTLVVGFSWTVWLVGLPRTTDGARLLVVTVGAWGPTLAAVGLTARADGWTGVRRLLGRLGRWRVAPRWYAVALATVPLSAVVAVGVHVATGGHPPELGLPGGLGVVALPIVFAVNVFVGGPLAEELGWRGFATPLLADRVGSLRASIVVGVVWALWHLPFFVALPAVGTVGEFPLWAYVPVVVAWSVAFSRVVAAGNGSVLLAVLFHASANTTLGTLAVVDAVRPGLLATYVLVQVAVVAILVGLVGRGSGDASRAWLPSAVHLSRRED